MPMANGQDKACAQCAEKNQEIEDLGADLDHKNGEINELKDQAEGDAEIVKALREWFEKKGVEYYYMDHDTAQLWKVLNAL